MKAMPRPWPVRLAARRLPRLLPVLVLLLGGVFGGSGCQRGPERPDIVLVTIDTLRADHCSAYGYPVPTTPVLDALAKRGVLYRRAYAESATTAPSHAVLLTGRHFRTLGVTRNGATVPDEAVTLAETLREQGYATAGFISSYPLRSRFGFGQGFDVYDDTFETAEASIGRRKEGEKSFDRLAAATVEHALAWLAQREDDRPVFIWMHFVDPHAPYRAPEKFEAVWPGPSRPVVERYDAEVRYADKQLGIFLEQFAARTPGRSDLVVVTSDHGEGLGDHGWMAHGTNLHEEAVRIPLVVSWPGQLPENVVEEAPVGIVDIAPGILDLLGIEAPSFAHGRPLFAKTDPGRRIFLQRRDYRSEKDRGRRIAGEMTAVVAGGHKLIVAPKEKLRALYDLGADPLELRELLGSPGITPGKAAPPAPPAPEGAEKAAHEATSVRMEDELNRWHQAFPPEAGSDAPMDEETLKALRSLGYVD